MTPPHRDALGRAMRARRAVLDEMTIEDAARGAGISPTTWINIEHGRPSRERTHVRLERQLGWAPGSCEAILAGGEPTIDRELHAAWEAARREEEERAVADKQLVVVDLSVEGSPVVILAAGGVAGISETTRRALLKQASAALEHARHAYHEQSGATRADVG